LQNPKNLDTADLILSSNNSLEDILPSHSFVHKKVKKFKKKRYEEFFSFFPDKMCAFFKNL